MHQWHHLSVESTSFTGVSFRITEDVIYAVLFALPQIIPFLMGTHSLVTVFAYQFMFDLANAFGHTNFEIFSPKYLDSFWFYLFYPPSFHRAHHTHFTCNYALFMPLWDVIFGTYSRQATLENMMRAEASTKIEYKFLTHPVVLDNIIHWQGRGALKQYHAERCLTIWEYLAGVINYVWSAVDVFFLGPLGFCTIEKMAQCKTVTGAYAGAVTFIPVYALWFYLPWMKSNIVNYQCAEVLRTQQRFPDCHCIGLGGLNKMESLNSGGVDIVEKLGDKLKLHIVHGNTMTAAACTQTLVDMLRKNSFPSQVFLTGCTSKVGRAVALALNAKGVKILMLSQSRARVEEVISQAVNPEMMEWVDSYERGESTLLWINGKVAEPYITNHIPRGARIINFAQPSGFELLSRERFDALSCQVVHGAIFKHDGLNYRQMITQSQLLPLGMFYACHVGTIVHCGEKWRFNEVGPVQVDRMEACLSLAENKYGFSRQAISVFPDDGVDVAIETREHALASEVQELRAVSASELAHHNQSNDCWVAIRGIVYDLTEFIDRHPGGQKSIISMAGKDATRRFDAIHPAGTIDKYLPPVAGKLLEDRDIV